MKREDYISWNELFMGIAKLAAQRSKDPSTQCGACIAKNNKVIGVGYNGMPNGIPDDDDLMFPWTRDGDFLHSKYAFVVHAELNAILNTIDPSQLKGATMFCTLAPCNECAKAIIQAGIETVIFDASWRTDEFHLVARRLLEKVGVKLISFNGDDGN
ncbi:hypothetical protein LCGC14_1213540 [marine sediment metagenome]|uniref:CMP/dCMP-type deaminase domain-containing protein n=1 Tax=marine sediment metagenome TaxID=412755 RepID=A0A0F9PHZ0_9ZZZZ